MTSVGTVVSSPFPPYSNPPIQPYFFIPSVFQISAITLGQSTTVTTTLDMNYVIGQEVRLLIPPSFGSIQLNQKTGFVLSIPASNQVVLSINSLRNVDAFISSSAATVAQIVAVGDINTGVTNTSGRSPVGTFIPGSFLNISPRR